MLGAGLCSITASQAGNATYAAAVPVTQSFTVAMNLLSNGGFESGSLAPWVLLVDQDGQVAGSAALDSTTAVDGVDSAHITIAAAGTANWHLDFEQGNLPLVAGATYQFKFWAKADSARWVTVSMQGGPPNYSNYGLYTFFDFGTTWSQYTASFVAPITATDGRLQFYLGSNTGNVWLDDVQVFGTTSMPQTITFAQPASEMMASSSVSLVATASSGLAVSFASTTASVCTVIGSTANLLASGTCSITATQTGNAAYGPATPVVQSFSVELNPQAIAFPALSTQGLGGIPISVPVSASSGLAVSLASGTTAVCAASGLAVALLNVGVCTLTASQNGNAIYSAATSETQSFLVTSNLIVNGGFESGSLAPWVLLVDGDSEVAGTAALDSTTSVQGTTSAHITISSAGTANWHLDFEQPSLSLVAGATYQVQFWATADSARSFPVVMQGGAPNYSNYGLYASVTVGTSWRFYTASFVATSTATDGRLQFYLGSNIGNVWFDNVQVYSTAAAAQTITFAAPAAQAFGTAPFSIGATASSGLAVAFNPTTPAVCSISASTVTLLATGTCSITASQGGNAAYAIANPVTQSFVVTPEQQSIVFATIASKITGVAPFAVSAAATSGLAINLISTTTTVCSVSGITVTVLAAGTCSITASQAGNANVAAAASVTQSFAVTQTAPATGVELTWDAPTSSADPVAGYNVYRAPGGSSAYQLVNAAIETQTTYVDNTVVGGQTYDYIVESVDSSGVQSAPSNMAGITVP
jgi:hypothetical protein